MQNRLRLAKFKYEHCRLPHSILNLPLGSDKLSESLSGSSLDCCETPSTSPPPRAATYCKNLSRLDHSKHAVNFKRRVTQPILSTSCKRQQSDPDAERSAKVRRFSEKSSYHLLESSIDLNRPLIARQKHVPVMSEAPTPSAAYHSPLDGNDYLKLTIRNSPNLSPIMGSSPPAASPAASDSISHKDWLLQHDYEAELQRYLANSPTPACVATSSRHQALAPCTPPNQYATLSPVIPSYRTPGQQLDFSEFVNLTPSPAQPACGDLTPSNSHTSSLSIKDVLDD